MTDLAPGWPTTLMGHQLYEMKYGREPQSNPSAGTAWWIGWMRDNRWTSPGAFSKLRNSGHLYLEMWEIIAEHADALIANVEDMPMGSQPDVQVNEFVAGRASEDAGWLGPDETWHLTDADRSKFCKQGLSWLCKQAAKGNIGLRYLDSFIFNMGQRPKHNIRFPLWKNPVSQDVDDDDNSWAVWDAYLDGSGFTSISQSFLRVSRQRSQTNQSYVQGWVAKWKVAKTVVGYASFQKPIWEMQKTLKEYDTTTERVRNKFKSIDAALVTNKITLDPITQVKYNRAKSDFLQNEKEAHALLDKYGLWEGSAPNGLAGAVIGVAIAAGVAIVITGAIAIISASMVDVDRNEGLKDAFDQTMSLLNNRKTVIEDDYQRQLDWINERAGGSCLSECISPEEAEKNRRELAQWRIRELAKVSDSAAIAQSEYSKSVTKPGALDSLFDMGTSTMWVIGVVGGIYLLKR